MKFVITSLLNDLKTLKPEYHDRLFSIANALSKVDDDFISMDVTEMEGLIKPSKVGEPVKLQRMEIDP